MTKENNFDRDFGTGGKGQTFAPRESQETSTYYKTVGVFKFLKECYEGSGGFDNDGFTYLMRDTTENFFETRAMLSHFNNEMNRYITTKYKRVITDEDIKYETTSATLADMLKDIDRRGSSIDSLKDFETAYALLQGTGYQASGHDGEKGKTPWVVYYSADQLEESMIKKDKFKNITQYVFYTGDNTYDLYTADTFKRLLDKKCTKKLEKMVVIEESEMPAMVVSPLRAISAFGQDVQPMPRDTYAIAKLLLGIFEMESRLIQLFTKQLFSRLVVRGDIDALPEGVTNAIGVDAEGGIDMLSPDPNIAKAYMERIRDLYSQLYEHMRDGGVIAVSTSQIPESGVAKAYTWIPVQAALMASISVMQDIDEYVVWAHNLWLGDNATMEVKYKTEYAPSAQLGALELRELWSIVSMSTSKKLKDAVLTQVVEAINVDSNSSLYAEIVNDIASSVDDGLE